MIVSQVLDELGISLDQELSEITPGLDRPHIQTTQPVSNPFLYDAAQIITGVETASHAGHCPVNLVNVW